MLGCSFTSPLNKLVTAKKKAEAREAIRKKAAEKAAANGEADALYWGGPDRATPCT